MDDKPQIPRNPGITITQNTAIRQAAAGPETVNPYVARTGINNDKPVSQTEKKPAGSITVTQNTSIRDAEKAAAVINPYTARSPVKPQMGFTAPGRSLIGDGKQNVKNLYNLQGSTGAQAVAAYITVAETGIKVWKAAQAATPGVIGGAKVTLKVVRGTWKAAKGTIFFLSMPIDNIKYAAAYTKVAVTRVAGKVADAVKTNAKAVAATAKKTYTVVRGVIKGTIPIPQHLVRKIIVSGFKLGFRATWFVGKISVKSAVKVGIKGIKIGGSSVVAIGGMVGKNEGIGTQAFAASVTAGKYAVTAVKYSPKAVKGVYTVGKTAVKTPIYAVKGGVSVVKTTVKVVKSVKTNGLAKTAGKVGNMVKRAAVKVVKAAANAIQMLVKAAARKIIMPLIIIVTAFILIFQIIMIPVQAGGAIFGSVFSFFTGDKDKDKPDIDVRQYVTDAATAARTKFEQDIIDDGNSNLKANGGSYDYVRIYLGDTCEDQVKDGLPFDQDTVDKSVFTLDELVNLASPVFNAIILTKYNLEPTETEAKDTVDEIISTLLAYKSQAMKTEWCEYEDGDPTVPHYCECGSVHAHIDCPNYTSGYHTTWTCPLCDEIVRTIEHEDDGDYVTEEFYCSGYKYCLGHAIYGIFISQDGWYELTDKYFQQPIDELSSKETRTEEEEQELQSLKDGYDLAMAYINETALSFGDLTVSDLSGVNFLPGDRPGAQAIPDYAETFVGNVGGQPFWSWYGFAHREEWCGCFVSYVLSHNGMDEPKYSSCEAGANWFKDHGQWIAGSGYAAVAGDIIFFDWNGKGETHHTGIVIGHDDTYVYTVEGNSANDMCRIRQYLINSSVIFGYGLPNY